MSEYVCDCGLTYTTASALMYCPCLYEDKYGRPRPIKGGDWIE